MIKIALCDDGVEMRRCLAQKITAAMNDRKEPFELALFGDPTELLESPLDCDLLFLDIQMPRLDGVKLAKKLRAQNIDCALIFVTVLEEHVYDAFEVEAVDYLLKPVDQSRFEKALDRVLDRIKENETARLLFPIAGGWRAVKFAAICYCEVINRKIYLHTRDGVIEYYGVIEEVEKQLDKRFYRCHRSYLINLDCLREYANDEILLDNGARIPLSRLRRKAFLAAMFDYLKAEAR